MIERIVYLYRTVLVLSGLMSCVWIGFLIGDFVPTVRPADEAVLGATSPVPWFTYLFYAVFVVAEVVAVPTSVLTAVNMWKPVHRQSRLFKHCAGVPKDKPWKWPMIDVFIVRDQDDPQHAIDSLKVCDWLLSQRGRACVLTCVSCVRRAVGRLQWRWIGPWTASTSMFWTMGTIRPPLTLSARSCTVGGRARSSPRWSMSTWSGGHGRRSVLPCTASVFAFCHQLAWLYACRAAFHGDARPHSRDGSAARLVA